MTYMISDREKEIVNDPARYPDERIQANLALLRDLGAAEADGKPMGVFDAVYFGADQDFTGYATAWIEVLEAEQQRRLAKEWMSEIELCSRVLPPDDAVGDSLYLL